MNNSKLLQYPEKTDFLAKRSGSQLRIQPEVVNELISSTNNSTTAWTDETNDLQKMNNWKVFQRPVGTKLLAKCNANQLQIQTDMMHELMSSTNDFSTAELPVAIISAEGQPSTGKTAYANAIMWHFQPMTTLHEEDLMMSGFPDPIDFQHVEQQKIDAILVSAPPFIVEDNDGRRAVLILLDVWNNDTMSEEVYMKLMDFCFHVSSIRIVIAGGPLRQISWWVGDCPSISSEHEERHWLSIANSLSKAQDGDEAGGSYLIFLNGQSSVRKLCRSVRDVDKGSLDICTSDFDFIMEQIFSPQTEELGCKLSDLEARFMRSLNHVNYPQLTQQPELSVTEEEDLDPQGTEMEVDLSDFVSVTLSQSQTVATTAVSPERGSLSQYELGEAFREHVRQAYAGSSQLYLTSGEFLQLLGQFQSQSNDAQLSNHRQFVCIRKFYDTVQAINTVIAHRLENYSAEVENTFAFGIDPESCQALHRIQHYQTRAPLIADEIATSMVAQLKLQELQLPRETGIFTFKLKTKIQSDIVNSLEYLEQQIKVCQAGVAPHKQTLHRKIEYLVCISEENFDEAVMYSRSVLAQMATGIICPALQTAVVKAAENYESEQQLRLYNQPTFEAEFDFARTALLSSITVMEQLLTSHLQQHKIMTDRELVVTFTFLCRTAKEACSSVSECCLNDAWKAAWENLEPSLENSLSKLRRENQNVIRKWDRKLYSAIEKSTLAYNQEMDQRLPTYSLPVVELDTIHRESAQYTLEKFTVSCAVNEETRNYWMRVLELSKLKEWRHGYTLLNEKKKPPTHAKQMAADIDNGNSQAKLLDLAACHVGIHFGPEVVIFTALVPNGRLASSEISLEITPYLAFFSDGKIICGKQATKIKRQNRALFNIFSILAQLPEPTKSLKVEINGQIVSMTPEAVVVLFFREAIKKLTEITGNRVKTCTVAHPGQLRDEATTVITDAIKISGFSKVTLIPVTTSLALSYVYPLLERHSETTTKQIEFVAVYFAGEILEISLIQMTGREPEVKHLEGFCDFRLRRKNKKSFTELMRMYLQPKDLFATVLMLGTEDEDNVFVHDILIKVVGDLNCPHNQVTYTSAIAKIVADIDAGILAYPHRPHQQGLSGDSQLPPAWDGETLKVQVENLVRLMDPGTLQPSPKKQTVINEEESKIASEVNSLRYQLAQLVQRVQEALEKSSASKGPLYGFINQSVQQCQQLLQIATTSNMELTMAMNKLQIRSEDLLKESS